MIYDIMNDKQRKDYEEFLETDFLFRDTQAGALSRQRIQPEPRVGCGVPHDSIGDSHPGRSGCAADFQGCLHAPARAWFW